KGAEQNAKTEAQPVIGRNRTGEANSRLTVRGWLWLVDANHAYTLPYCSSDVKHFPQNNSQYFCRNYFVVLPLGASG
uniref:hypothetical protein n=1 Tax=Gemmiger formicilis TaxID=745368 RepID=UPI003FEF6383